MAHEEEKTISFYEFKFSIVNDKNEEKSKTFHDPVRSPVRTSIFFSRYSLNFIEVQLNICFLYNENNFDPRAKGHS